MDFDATHEPVGDAAVDDGDVYEAYAVPPVAEFGTEQAVAYDWDGDGVNDSLVGYLDGIGSFDATDFDQDGDIDYLAVDTDGDGVYDVLITNNYDTGGYDVQWDSDGDGTLDSTSTVTAEDIAAASPDLWNLINEHYTPLDLGGQPEADPAQGDPAQIWYPQVVDGQLDDPFVQGDQWFSQSWDGSVVPSAVMEIYSAYSQTTVTSEQFVQVVNTYDDGGWATGPDGAPGMTPETAAGILEANGVQATCSYASMSVLEQAVTSQGYTVLVAYDTTTTTVTSVSYETSAVYLATTDTTGQPVAVPLQVFEQSWAASEYTMIESTQTVPDYQATDTASIVQQATTGPWALLPISGTTIADATR